MLNYKTVLSLIEKGESLNTEFKLDFSTHEKIAKEIIAFANTKGGIIIFGVDDRKRIIGIQSEKAIAGLIEETIRDYCEPLVEYQIEYKEIDNKELVFLIVEESKIKPHRVQDYKKTLDINTAMVYIRVNDKSIPAGKEMIRLLRLQENDRPLQKYNIGKTEKFVFDYLNENEKISAKQLAELVNISGRRASRTLVNMLRADLLAIHVKENGDEFFTLI